MCRGLIPPFLFSRFTNTCLSFFHSVSVYFCHSVATYAPCIMSFLLIFIILTAYRNSQPCPPPGEITLRNRMKELGYVHKVGQSGGWPTTLKTHTIAFPSAHAGLRTAGLIKTGDENVIPLRTGALAIPR